MTAVIVFLKFPVPGQVKTRLAKDIGNERATAIYRKLIQITFAQCAALPTSQFQTIACVDGRTSVTEYASLLKAYRPSIQTQCEGNLGDRLTQSTESNLLKFSKVIVIGTDCPGITASLLQKASDQLESVDVILGPALDGGYYLIGLRKNLPLAFQGISWSTELVLAQTTKNLDNAGVSWKLLEPLLDIDTEEDLPLDWRE